MLSSDDIRQLREQGRLILCLKESVYDLTNFQHPGGPVVIRTASLGSDAWGSFSTFHDDTILQSAKPFLIGKCTSEIKSGERQMPTVHSGTSFLAAKDNESSTAIAWWERVSETELQQLSINGCKEEAGKRVASPLLLYWNLGNEDNQSLLANETAWNRFVLRPRVLRDVRSVTTSSSILGYPLACPLLVAPFASSCNAHPEGELAIARACALRNLGFIVPHFGGFSVKDIAQTYFSKFSPPSIAPNANATAISSSPLFFQYYCRGTPQNNYALDRVYTEAVLKYAEQAGYKAVFVTVDSAVLGIREQTYGSVGWVKSLQTIPTGGFAKIKTFFDIDQGRSQAHSAGLCWEDIKWMATLTSLKVVVKGIMNPLDAAIAAQPGSGVAGIVISNHGGRQMDGTEGTADVLAECVAAVRATAASCNVSPIEVYVDGGIRRGKDILRALALGARACLVGRPILWGLAVGGEAGVGRVLDCLFNEFRNSLQLCGQQAATDVDASILRPQGRL